MLCMFRKTYLIQSLHGTRIRECNHIFLFYLIHVSIQESNQWVGRSVATRYCNVWPNYRGSGGPVPTPMHICTVLYPNKRYLRCKENMMHEGYGATPCVWRVLSQT